LAEEIATRTVNKERAQHGESTEASASSINDMSASRRGGRHSHQGPGGRTLLQLRNEARQRGLGVWAEEGHRLQRLEKGPARSRVVLRLPMCLGVCPD